MMDRFTLAVLGITLTAAFLITFLSGYMIGRTW